MSAPSTRKTVTARVGRKPAAGGSEAERILNGFTGPAPRVPTSFFYKLGMLVVAITMLLLPLIYLGLIGLVGYGVYYHAAENVDMLSPGGGSGMRPRRYILTLLAYVAPLFAGAILILFMIKPIFARSVKDDDALTLDASQEPLLYAFIEKLCKAIGAPTPRRIEVDGQVNAAAGFRRGLWSLFSSDMVLLIGLPIAAGLPLNQFVGILAHEFGHFSQGSAMRLSYIVERVNLWFARVVYQRDSWDEWLEDMGDTESAAVQIIVLLTRLAVWLSRRALWILMMLGELISSAVSRQMEYDADRRAAAVVGSAAMAKSLRQSSVLSEAFWISVRELELSWEQRKLVDNFPALIAATAKRLSPKAEAEIIEGRSKERTSLFGSHPTFSRREASLARYDAKGVFDVDAPATALFANFRMIANAVSLTLYRYALGPDVKASNLIPVEQIVKEHDRVRKEQAALPGYFQDSIESCEPLFLGVSRISPPQNPKQTLAQLRAARKQFEQAAPQYRKLASQIAQSRQQIQAAATARLLMRAGFKLKRKQFTLEEPTAENAESAIKHGELAVRHGMAKMNAYYKLLRIRLLSALELARVEEIRKRLKPELTNDAEIDRVVAALEALERANPILARMTPTQNALTHLFDCDEDEEMHEAFPLLPAVEKSTAEKLYGTMQDIRSILSDTAYPFERTDGEITVCKYVTPKAPNPSSPSSINVTCEHLLDRSAMLYSLCMARLVRLAEAVERIAGMPPLAAPKPDDGDPDSKSAQ